MRKLHAFLQKLILLAIRVYQVTLSPLQALFPQAGCRFWPSCSEYTYQEIKERGILAGVRTGVAQFLKCNPWTS